jgi:hypothetical protein
VVPADDGWLAHILGWQAGKGGKTTRERRKGEELEGQATV